MNFKHVTILTITSLAILGIARAHGDEAHAPSPIPGKFEAGIVGKVSVK